MTYFCITDILLFDDDQNIVVSSESKWQIPVPSADKWNTVETANIYGENQDYDF